MHFKKKKKKTLNTIVIIVWAGRGLRAGSGTGEKPLKTFKTVKNRERSCIVRELQVINNALKEQRHFYKRV